MTSSYVQELPYKTPRWWVQVRDAHLYEKSSGKMLAIHADTQTPTVQHPLHCLCMHPLITNLPTYKAIDKPCELHMSCSSHSLFLKLVARDGAMDS